MREGIGGAAEGGRGGGRGGGAASAAALLAAGIRPAAKGKGAGKDDDGDVDEVVGIGDAAAGTAAKEASPVPSSLIPPYPQRKARKFVPRRQADFADGGAYPEIHVAQYPLNMGKPGARASDSAGTLALTVRPCTAPLS